MDYIGVIMGLYEGSHFQILPGVWVASVILLSMVSWHRARSFRYAFRRLSERCVDRHIPPPIELPCNLCSLGSQPVGGLLVQPVGILCPGRRKTKVKFLQDSLETAQGSMILGSVLDVPMYRFTEAVALT